MSMKELVFNCEDCGNKHTIKFDEEKDLIFKHACHTLLVLDRSEAHLLMLYLQEHLK